MERSLIKHSENLWTVASAQKVFGFEFGTRMSVIRFKSGDILLYSPVPITKELKGEIDHLGEVRYLLAPNRFHHLYLQAAADQYPRAEIWGAPGLPEKRKDINFQGVITDKDAFGQTGELEHFLFEGMPLMNEVIFFHPESRTLIVSDMLFNFPKDLSLKFTLFLKIFGMYGEPKISILERWLMVRDKRKAKESAERVLSLDFDRVVLAHRDIIPTGGKEIVSKAYSCFGIRRV